jgi:hypothetical protein
MHRKTENADIYILFNESEEFTDYRINLPSSKGYLLDLMSGDLQHLQAENGVLHVFLVSGESAVMLLTDEEYNAEKIKDYKSKFDIPDNFTFRKTTELVLGENGFENINYSEKAVMTNLGDWSYEVGSAYSGSCTYETGFTLPDEMTGKGGEISLGEVHFSACVYLNESCLGTVLMPPYRLKIPSGLLNKDNELKIVVTNTSANRYLNTDYFDKWSIKELSPYFEPELDYAKDSVSGGLYGPVVLYLE